MGKNATYTSYNFTGSKAKQCYTGAFIQCFKTNVTSLQQKSKELIPHNKRVVLSNIFNTCLQQTSSGSIKSGYGSAPPPQNPPPCPGGSNSPPPGANTSSCCGSNYPYGPYSYPEYGYNIWVSNSGYKCYCSTMSGKFMYTCPPSPS